MRRMSPHWRDPTPNQNGMSMGHLSPSLASPASWAPSVCDPTAHQDHASPTHTLPADHLSLNTLSNLIALYPQILLSVPLKGH